MTSTIASPLGRPAQFLKGVGPKRALALDRLGVRTARDLVYHVPRRYEDASTVAPIASLEVGMDVTIIGEVVSKGVIPTRKGLRIFQAVLRDRTGLIECAWPGQPFLDRSIQKGDLLLVTGPVKFFHGRRLQPREHIPLGRADAKHGATSAPDDAAGRGAIRPQPDPSPRRATGATGLAGATDAAGASGSTGSDATDASEATGSDATGTPDAAGATRATGAADDGARRQGRHGTGMVLPIYPAGEGLSQRMLRTILDSNLDTLLPLVEAEDAVPQPQLERAGLLPLRAALESLHRPSSIAAAEQGRRRLAYDELFFLQLVHARARRRTATARPGISFRRTDALIGSLYRRLPFALTGAQTQVLREIFEDMASSRRMNRLLQGDVGSGKTVVALFAMVLAVENGCQAALMAPTEILADQHARTLRELLGELPVELVLLTGGLTASEREDALRRIESGAADLVVGTHALIQQGVNFHRLGLAVIDEQHRFGVRQRMALAAPTRPPADAAPGAEPPASTSTSAEDSLHAEPPGPTSTAAEDSLHAEPSGRPPVTGTAPTGPPGVPGPDQLVMSATPIPRSLALTLYGDLDISVLHERPAGRPPIRTVLRDGQSRARVHDFIREQVAAGRQAYIVYPLVEESEKLELRAAADEFDRLRDEVFPDLRIGLLHGQMAGEEKDAAMLAFAAGEVDILVATTVIEVGIDVPNATVMLIEHANRFGLSQLHQLRGRVGRGAVESYCILITAPGEGSAHRLDVLASSDDGFEIARADLRLRGMGDFFGARQHGLPRFRFFDPEKDEALLARAQTDARTIIDRDPELGLDAHRRLREAVQTRYAEREQLYQVG